MPKKPTRSKPRPVIKVNPTRVVSVVRTVGERLRHGLVLGVGRAWVLVRSMRDFLVDGYECFRVEHISAIRQGAWDRFATKALAHEGVLQDLPQPRLSLGDTRALLLGLRELPIVALECEHDEDFLIGKLLRVGTKSVDIQFVRPDGTWFALASRVLLEDITRIEFDDQYGAMYAKCAVKRPKSKGIEIRRRGL